MTGEGSVAPAADWRRTNNPELARRIGGLHGSNDRNIAIYGNLIIDTSVDLHLFALDAMSGEIVWETPVLELHQGPCHPRHGADRRERQGRLRAKLSCRMTGPTPASSSPSLP